MLYSRVIWVVLIINQLTGSCTKTVNKIQMAGTEVQEVSMYDHCHGMQNKQTLVDKSLKVVLKSKYEEVYGEEVDCLVTFKTRETSARLFISFESLDISCEKEGRSHRLEIYDGPDDQLRLTKAGGLCGSYKKTSDDSADDKSSDYYYRAKHYSSVTLQYYGKPTKEFSGFSVILTVTKDAYANGTCGRDSFKCKSDYCIPEELQCNGYINCEDGIDEEDCVKLPDHTDYQANPEAENIGMLIGGSISILIMMIVAVWLGIVCVKRMITKREYERRQNMLPSGPVIDADHVPPFIADGQIITRPRPPPLHTMLDPPPLYSDHVNHDHACPYELPPPYTPDGCDTAELLNQTQGLSLDTPPAYRTIDPNFNPINDHQLHTYHFPRDERLDGVEDRLPVHLQNNNATNDVNVSEQQASEVPIMPHQPLIPVPATATVNNTQIEQSDLIPNACQVEEIIVNTKNKAPVPQPTLSEEILSSDPLPIEESRAENNNRLDYQDNVNNVFELEVPHGINENMNNNMRESACNCEESDETESLEPTSVHFYRKVNKRQS